MGQQVEAERIEGDEAAMGSGFGSSNGAALAQRTGETAGMAQAAKAKALVQARYVMALERPRSIDKVRVNLLAECRRPGFAEAARYQVRNRGAGPSIRFAEAWVRLAGNIDTTVTTLYDDEDKRIVNVAATDLETNATWSKDITIQKTVERKSAQGREVVGGVRTNSYGEQVYIVRATDEELLTKENAVVSKALRVLSLRLCPGDIVDECMAQVMQTQRDRDAKDPAAARKALADGFARLNVMPDQLEQYLGGPLANVSPADLTELRGVWSAIGEGETTWKQALADRLERDGRSAKATGKAKAKGGVGAVAEALGAQEEAGDDSATDPGHGQQQPLPTTADLDRAAAARVKAGKAQREIGEEG